MADEAISQMPDAAPLGGSEIIPLVQSLLNKSVTVTELVRAFVLGLTPGALVFVSGDSPGADPAIFRSGAGAVTLNLLNILVGLALPGIWQWR